MHQKMFGLIFLKETKISRLEDKILIIPNPNIKIQKHSGTMLKHMPKATLDSF